MWYGEQFYCPDPLLDLMVGYGLSMDPCWVNMVYLLYGSLYPLIIHKGIHTGNKPSAYRGSIQEMEF
jgi:hypothetical protein